MDIRHRQRRRWNQVGRCRRVANSQGAQSPGARLLAVQRLESRALLSAVSFTGNYSQDFDSLPIDGTSFFYSGVTSFDARPIEAAAMAGWQLHKSSGSSDFATFIADNGHGASSSVRSFGDFDMPDRALGSIANQLGGYAYGVTLTNDTGGTLTSITLSFTGEQWQESGALAAQALHFEFAVGEGASLDQGTFAAAPSLDFTAPQYGGTARTLDGNAAANRTAVTATIIGLSWAPGEELVLRWTDSDDADADHGLGIDDLTVTAAPLNLSAPIFTAGAVQTLEIPENSPSGTMLGVAAATDPDLPVEPLTYSITAGDALGAFAIDANGQLTIVDAALVDLDFENGAEVAVLTVQVTD
ncbi:MAG: cadherin repeat domain-containing protein, partial [Planctomycetaceae bacterium]|nr:cadherin repeat domain-containing protein [Planctomycetaceae bacterium]